MSASPPAAERAGRAWIAALVIVALAVALRLPGLARSAPFIDEAETAVNALTVLEHGLPRSEYLGLPVFENTLTEPWPASAEYEFADTSYGPRGLARYHGWLPIYVMAGSFLAFGVRPDAVPAIPAVRHGDAEIARRVLASRLPSVAFAALFVWCLYVAGKELHSAAAGLAAALVAALSTECIVFGQQARYYSATLALSTAAAWAAARTWKRGSAGDWALWCTLTVLLFHTHALAALVATVAIVPGLLKCLRQQRLGPVLAAAAVLGLATLPWAWWTGLFAGSAGGPPARKLFEWPEDLYGYFAVRVELAVALAALLVAWGAAELRVRRRATALSASLAAARPALLFALAWLSTGYLLFHALVPAASFFYSRLTLLLIPPGLLLLGVLASASARLFLPRAQALASVAACGALVLAGGRAFAKPARNESNTRALQELIAHLRTQRWSADTRLYALPNQHLVLQFTAGLPVQSIAPVRRDFLESYPGEIVLLESADPTPAINPQDLRECGVPDEAPERARELRAQLRHADLARRVRTVESDSPPPDDPWFECLRAISAEKLANGEYGADLSLQNPPLLRGFAVRDVASFWPVFFYRFVDPRSRSGAALNFAGRMRTASSQLLRSGWAVHRAPPLSEAAR